MSKISAKPSFDPVMQCEIKEPKPVKVGRKKGRRHNAHFRRLYKASGLTAMQIADLLGVSHNAVESWLKTKNTPCQKHRVEALKEALRKLQ